MSGTKDPEFSHLPREIITKILGLLSYKDLCVLVRVSKTWWELGGDPFIWRHFKLQVTGSSLEHIESILSMQRLASISYISCLHGVLESSHLDIISNTTIKQVVFGGCDFTRVWPEVLALMVNKMESVSLSLKVGTKLSIAQKIQMFSLMTQTTKLTELELLFIDLSEVSVSMFVMAITSMERVSLKGNNLTMEQKVQLFQTLSKETKIVQLKMMKNDLNSVPYDDLAKSLNNLEKVEILHCRLYPPQIVAIFEEISRGTNICDLNLKFNILSSVSPDILASALGKIESVNIAGCRLKRDQVSKLFEMMTDNDTLAHLDISQNDLSEVSSDVLAKVINNLKYANVAHAKINRTQMKNILIRSSGKTNLQYLNIKGNDMEIYPNELFRRTSKKIKEFHYKMENLEIYGHGCRW